MFESFNVAVKISLIDGVSKPLEEIVKAMEDAEKKADKLGEAVKKAGEVGEGGGKYLEYFSKGVEIINKGLENASESSNERINQQIRGRSLAEMAQAYKFAQQTTHEVAGSKLAENLKLYNEVVESIRGMGDAGQEAAQMLTPLQKTLMTLEAMGGKSEGIGSNIAALASSRLGAKATEQQVQAEVAKFARVHLAFGGQLNSDDYTATVNHEQDAGQHFGDSYVLGILPSLVQLAAKDSNGEYSAATIQPAMDKALAGQELSASTLKAWLEAGLIKRGDAHKERNGHWVVRPGAVKDFSTYQYNPFEWTLHTLQPALEALARKHGWSNDQAIDNLFSDHAAAFGFSSFIKNHQLLEEGGDVLLHRAATPDQAYGLQIGGNIEF